MPVIYCGWAYKSKNKLELHKALLFLGDVFFATKDNETATNLYIVALEGFTHMDIHCSRAQCMAKDVAQVDVRLSTVNKAHQKSLLQLTTLSAPDWSLTRETSEIPEVETAFLLPLRQLYANYTRDWFASRPPIPLFWRWQWGSEINYQNLANK
ncbi:hypothetical protein B0H14DRAFT_2565613 [Mycena olivaceomarginata]|nr:hypothetical protein B0H14DRAFT_2565613 [Mycena olivaceomarginata]